MKDFLIKLKAFAELITSLGIAYIALNYISNLPLIIMLFVLAVFVLFQFLGDIDKINHYGPYNNTDSDSSDNNPYIEQDKHNQHQHNNKPSTNVNVNVDLNNDSDSDNGIDDDLTLDDNNDSHNNINYNDPYHNPYADDDDTISLTDFDEEESFINPDDFK